MEVGTLCALLSENILLKQDVCIPLDHHRNLGLVVRGTRVFYPQLA